MRQIDTFRGIGPGYTRNDVKCAINLRQIGIALQLYANQNHGQLPDRIEQLYETEEIGPEVFVCPVSEKETPSVAATTQAVVADLQAGGHLSYTYLGRGLKWDDKANAHAVLVFETEHRHYRGRNVLFGDGHAEMLTEKQFEQIDKQLAAKKWPVQWPFKPGGKTSGSN